ncbi:MAG: adenine deaminase C-terminal domain-containing protein [Desulfobacteraceae bacterium]
MKRYSLLSVEGNEKARELMDVSLGKKSADLAIINATILNVYTGEFLKDHTILVKGEWIAYVGPANPQTIGAETTVLDAAGKTVIPGLIDGHTHLADNLYCPSEFLPYAMKGGTTTIITETIEPFPIRGEAGIIDFLESLKDQPIKIFATVPPLASTSKASHGMPKETLKNLLMRDDVIGLGESYWQAVLQDPEIFLPNFEETFLSGRKVEGHSAGAKDRTLSAYIASGVSSCHEAITAEEALEKLRLGIHVMVREGSIRGDLKAISALKDADIDLRRLILVTDGMGAEDLIRKGYMEYVVQKAIDCGFDPAKAIQMATINVAEYFLLDGMIGGIAPGRQADLLIIPDSRTIRAEAVISKGNLIAKDGELLVSPRKHAFSPETLNSVHLKGEMKPADFAIPVEGKMSRVTVRVIDQVTELVTREFMASVPVVDGEIRSDTSKDLLKVAAVDRRFSPGKTYVGLIRGFRLKTGAVACSSSWDTSDIVVVGENDEDMAESVNRIRALQGGAVLCAGGKLLAEIPMPIFGLMADIPIPELANRTETFRCQAKALGFPFNDPHRTLVTLTGAAIPFLRICEQGLVDIRTGQPVPLIG